MWVRKSTKKCSFSENMLYERIRVQRTAQYRRLGCCVYLHVWTSSAIVTNGIKTVHRPRRVIIAAERHLKLGLSLVRSSCKTLFPKEWLEDVGGELQEKLEKILVNNLVYNLDTVKNIL